MSRFPGVGQRVRQRLRALGYWKDGRPDVGRFCSERDYRPQYLYAWLGDRIPTYDNLARLARDLEVPRSEERRVGKECRSRWSPHGLKKKTRPRETWTRSDT